MLAQATCFVEDLETPNGTTETGRNSLVTTFSFARALVVAAFVTISTGVMSIAQDLSTLSEPVDPLPAALMRQVTATALRADPNNRELRYHYARLSFQTGDYGAAKYHLQVLLKAPKSDAERVHLLKAYAQVVRKDPIAFSGSFALLPSTNINKESESYVILTPYGPYVFEPEYQTGWGLHLGGRASYETVLPNLDSLTFGLQTSSYNYPQDNLDSLAISTDLAWTRVHLGGRRTLTPSAGRVFSGEQTGETANYTHFGIDIDDERTLTEQSSLTGSVYLGYRRHDDLEHRDGIFGSAGLRYANVTKGGLPWRVQAEFSRGLPELEHLQYKGISFGGEIQKSFDGFGTVGLWAQLSLRQYDAAHPLFGIIREDQSFTLGVSALVPTITVFNASPKLSCHATKTESTFAFVDLQSFDCALTFERSF